MGTVTLLEVSGQIYDERLNKFNRISRTSDEIFTDELINKLISLGLIHHQKHNQRTYSSKLAATKSQQDSRKAPDRNGLRKPNLKQNTTKQPVEVKKEAKSNTPPKSAAKPTRSNVTNSAWESTFSLLAVLVGILALGFYTETKQTDNEPPQNVAIDKSRIRLGSIEALEPTSNMTPSGFLLVNDTHIRAINQDFYWEYVNPDLFFSIKNPSAERISIVDFNHSFGNCSVVTSPERVLRLFLYTELEANSRNTYKVTFPFLSLFSDDYGCLSVSEAFTE